jgi:DNA-binding NtrC family response regulator
LAGSALENLIAVKPEALFFRFLLNTAGELLAMLALSTYLPFQNLLLLEWSMNHKDIAKKYSGFRHFQAKDFKQAIIHLEKDLRSFEINQDESFFLELIRTICLLETEQYEEALSIFFRLWTRRAEIRSFEPLKIQFNMALCLQRMSHPEKAIEHLDYVIEHCSQEDIHLRGLAYRQLASVWRMLNPQKAMEYSQLSLDTLSPEEGGIQQEVEELGLAFSLGEDKKFMKLSAKIDRRKMSAQQALRCDTYELLVLYRNERFSELLTVFKTIEKQLSADEIAVDIYAAVGKACLALGKGEQAEIYFGKAWNHYGRTGKILNRDLLTVMDSQIRSSELESLPYEQVREFGIIGISPPIIRMKTQLRRIREGNIPVLITGESGTGKELAARSFSQESKPFVAINCRAVATTLMSSLLFGHAKGAFTGAVQDSGGLVAQADGGVLFLDEVGDLPLDVQPLLYRFLDDGSFYRVGENVERFANVRIIAATNLDMHDSNQVRMELTNRLAGFAVEVPPLRDRDDDIIYLAAWFVKQFNAANQSTRTLGHNPATILKSYPYPGNVRELRFLLNRACTLCHGDFILPALEIEIERARAQSANHRGLQMETAQNSGSFKLEADPLLSRNLADTCPGAIAASHLDIGAGFNIQEERKIFEAQLRKRALELCGGNMRAAARLLGESPTGIQRMLQRNTSSENLQNEK